MKYIKFFLILLLIPFIALAEDTCNQDDIKIESIVLDSTNGNIEETSNPNADNNQVNLGLKMNVIDDNITYKLVITNTSNQDYTFDKNSLSTDYINYAITYEDNSDIVKAGESKVIFLTVNYSSKPSVEKLNNGVLIDNPKVTFNLQKEEAQTVIEEVVKAIVNPETKDVIGIFLLILIISLIITIVLFKKSKRVKYTIMIIILILLTSNIVKALCTCPLDINTRLEIDVKEAVFLPGKEVNAKMKELAGDDTTQEPVINTNITAIKYSEIEPDENYKKEENLASTIESEYPIYMWFDNGTIYLWSEDKTPSLNEDASYMFYYMLNLKDLSGLSNVDTSIVADMSFLFILSYGIDNIAPLEKWNISNVTDMTDMFGYLVYLTSLKPLAKWNTSNVRNMSYLFNNCSSITSLEGLENWDTSNVTEVSGMFLSCLELTSLKSLKKWDTSKITIMYAMFTDCNSLTNLEGIEDWDVSHVEDMSWMFGTQSRTFNSGSISTLSDISALTNWDISNLKNMSWMFFTKTALSDFGPIYNWNTANVTNMSSVFEESHNVEELDLSHWDTSNVTSLSHMFNALSSLKKLDISSFDTRKVTDFKRMFNGSNNIEVIYVGNNWNTEANTAETTYVFSNATKLRNFSTSNNNYRDLMWANIGENGYLTLKSN